VTDVTQGQDASDNDLFREALDSTTLEKFENPELPKVAPEPKPVEPKPAEPKSGEPPAQKTTDPDAPVPPGRLREEADARRRAERERDDLRSRLEALTRQPPQQQPTQQPQKVDLFENPSGFIKQEVSPFFEQFRQELQFTREAMSLDNAIARHGDDKVMAARQALEQGMQRGDQNIWGLYNRAMQSHDPYGVIVKWHHDRETLNSIGGDLESFRKKTREEALNDPEFLKAANERLRAAANGKSVNRPVVMPSVPNMPSLSNIGAGGGDEQQTEPSDEQLFRAAVTAKRR
jgi:hypothetical protein